jgi:hypothetical protein
MLLSKNCESSRLTAIAQPIWDLSAPHWPISLLGTWLADWPPCPFFLLIQINLHGAHSNQFARRFTYPILCSYKANP